MKCKCLLTFSLAMLSVLSGYGIAYGASNNITYVRATPDKIDVGEPIDEIVAVSAPQTIAKSEPAPEQLVIEREAKTKDPQGSEAKTIPTVPFYSQFTDISAPEWKKIGCGIASLAMLIDFYNAEDISVDELLNEGIAANAYQDANGWSHAGLIELAKDHGLTGEAVYMQDLSMTTAFKNLETALDDGPVMVSVHYTFEPTNPIPHLVIATGVADGMVYYNDPAEATGNGSVSIEQFQSAWKKRYIAIRL